jgi:hypothetical protein
MRSMRYLLTVALMVVPKFRLLSLLPLVLMPTKSLVLLEVT